jgi:hypothetical protein
MNRGHFSAWQAIIVIWAAFSPCWVLDGQGQGIDLDLGTLRGGPFAEMSMTLEKGLLFVQVEVARVRVTFGAETSSELQRLVQGREPSSRLADSIAAIAMQSPDALVELHFLRDVSLNRFISGSRDAAERVWKRGIISESTFDRIKHNLPFWYRSLKDRGIREGDLMRYRVRADSLHTVFTGSDGMVFVNQIDQGRDTVLAVMGGYFVKGSDFRDGLLDSLFESGR